MSVDDTIDLSGVIAPPPRADSIVSSPIAGRVASIAVDEGDRVGSNALIATIEDPALPANIAEARAGIASAQAAKTAADQEVVRQERLVSSGIGARKDLDDAKARAAAAAADVDAASARSGLANARLAHRELRAGRAGVVLHVFRKAGETVDGTSATPVAEVADLDVLELHAQVPPALLAKLHDGQGGVVHEVGDDAAIPATVARVSPAVDPATLLGLVRVQLGAGGHAPIGAAATAEIVLGRHDGVGVPPAALRRSAVGADEVVVCDHGVARVRTVELGKRGDAVVELATGVKPGEPVVVDHALGLVDGQALVEKP
jgi:RND family efflux transporter MFP subunit